MKVSSSLGKHWPTKGSNSFSIDFISSCFSIISSSTYAILKQKLKKKIKSYYMIYELYITNKMKIIILSWDNSFKSKQFIGTNWWASLASTLSSIGAILKQEFKI